MSQVTLNQRRWIVALVGLLALSVFALASLAKCSQYRETHSEGYLAKAVKIAGARCQAVEQAPPLTAPQMVHPEVPLRFLPPESWPVLAQAVFLDSFSFRPPPAWPA